MDAINELTMEELNMTFNGIQLGFGDWTDRIRLMLTDGEKLDIVPTYATQASAYVSQGLVLNLLDWNGTTCWKEYGSGIVEAVGETQAYGGQINGVLYGIPSQKEAMEPPVSLCGRTSSTSWGWITKIGAPMKT